MSAYEGTRQLYGRAKLACEADVLSVGGNAIRLGLVYGGGDGGMIGSLRRIAGLPVIPVIGRSSHQFMVHVADMASAMVRLVERAEIGSETAGLAHPEPVRFDALLRALAAVKGRQPTLVPLPWQPIYGAMRVAESLRLPLPLRADSVLGLVRPAPGVPNLELWDRLGVTLRPLELD
jgi:nucleoside-diphosphate-sugar epimerase